MLSSAPAWRIHSTCTVVISYSSPPQGRYVEGIVSYCIYFSAAVSQLFGLAPEARATKSMEILVL